jgi:CubicO group peptidase (beta-lactamase class C family)
LKKALQEFVHGRSAAGVTVAISYHDSPPAYPSAGTLAFNSAVPFDENSICRIYSITKHVTRVATLMLAEDGSWHWTSPSRMCCPSLRTCG